MIAWSLAMVAIGVLIGGAIGYFHGRRDCVAEYENRMKIVRRYLRQEKP